MKWLVAVLTSIVAGSATAQSARDSFESIETSCADAPREAKTVLPKQLADWATLSCSRFGHVIRAAPGWVWHAPQTNEFVRVWAQPSQGNLEPTGHADHFTKLEFQQLTPREAQEAGDVLAKSLGAKPQPVVDAFVLLLSDARGQAQAVHFVRTEANIRIGNLWGWACSYPCQKPIIFMGFKP